MAIYCKNTMLPKILKFTVYFTFYFIAFIKRCRICTDCGSRTPGGGSSSRWHSHYTICDSCYQQRNKGFSCPICQKAYRAAAYKEMVKCSWCHK